MYTYEKDILIGILKTYLDGEEDFGHEVVFLTREEIRAIIKALEVIE